MRNKLIILSGPSGIGKSTVAKRLHNAISQSFLLHRDVQHRFFGRDRDSSTGEITAGLLLVMADYILKSGKDVIFDWAIRNEDYMNSLYEVAERNNSKIVEIFLFADKEFVLDRSEKRGYGKYSFTAETCERIWEETNNFIIKRNNTNILKVENLSEEEVFDRVKKIVGI